MREPQADQHLDDLTTTLYELQALVEALNIPEHNGVDWAMRGISPLSPEYGPALAKAREDRANALLYDAILDTLEGLIKENPASCELSRNIGKLQKDAVTSVLKG